MVSWGVSFPNKMVPSLCSLLPPLMITSKSLPPPNLYALPSAINLATMTRQHTKFSLLLDLPGKPDHFPIANFGPISRGRITKPMLIAVFDTHSNPRSLRQWVWVKTLSDSEYSTLTHFSMSLVLKYANLKEPQDIKQQFTTKRVSKKNTGFTWNPQPQRHSVQKVFFKFNPLFVVLTFQIIYQ